MAIVRGVPNFRSFTVAVEDMTWWKGIVVKSSVVAVRHCKVIRLTRLD